jgi:hypothetical protein
VRVRPRLGGRAVSIGLLVAACSTTTQDLGNDDPHADGGMPGGADAGAQSDALYDDAGHPGPTLGYFGASCPTGTVYADPFTVDPVLSGDWTLVASTYTFDPLGHTVTLNRNNSSNAQMWIGLRPSWGAYTMSGRLTLADATGNGGFNIHVQSLPNPAPNDGGMMYFAGIQSRGGSVNSGVVIIGTETGGNGTAWNQVAEKSGTFVPGTSYLLQVAVKASTVTVDVNGVEYVTYTDPTFNLTSGSVAIRTYSSTVTFGPITVTCN